MSRPRVLLADDHRVVSEGLSRILADDFEVVGIVEDGRALLAAVRALLPDAVVADISMPRLNGIEVLIELRKELPDIKVVFLTMHQEPAYARRALDAGASGYVVKHSAVTELVMAVHAALKGQIFIAPSMAGEILRHPTQTLDYSTKLTPRQREILQLLSEGHSAKEIGATLAISARTVEFHKYQIMDTYGLHSSAELIHFAIKHGIVSL